MEQMLKLMEMMKIVESLGSIWESDSEADDYQYASNGDILRPLNAAMPYLDADRRRKLSVIIKILEIKMLTGSVDNLGGETQKTCLSDNWRIELLRAVKNEVCGEKRRRLNLLIRAVGFHDKVRGMIN